MWLTLLWHSLYCGSLELNLQYLRGMSKKIMCLENTGRKAGTCYMPWKSHHNSPGTIPFEIILPFMSFNGRKKLICSVIKCIVHYSYCVLFGKKKITWQLYSLHVANQIASSKVQIRQTLKLNFSFLLYPEAYAMAVMHKLKWK